MTTKQNAHYRMSPPGVTDKSEDKRCQGERREMKSDGFTYITSVGWICRLEKCRRNDDKFFV